MWRGRSNGLNAIQRATRAESLKFALALPIVTSA
jgi:hypothetical protein